MNRVALITGVGPGLGSAIARRFAREKFCVALVARTPDFITKLARELSSSGQRALAVVANVGQPAGRSHGGDREVRSEFGPIGVPGVRVINGQAAFAIEVSKAAQLALLRSIELPFPRTRVINCATEARQAATAPRLPRYHQTKMLADAALGSSGSIPPRNWTALWRRDRSISGSTARRWSRNSFPRAAVTSRGWKPQRKIPLRDESVHLG